MSEAVMHEEHHGDHPTGLKRWLFTTNHKDIGTLYLMFALIMFFVGGAMAMVIRAELFEPLSAGRKSVWNSRPRPDPGQGPGSPSPQGGRVLSTRRNSSTSSEQRLCPLLF